MMNTSSETLTTSDYHFLSDIRGWSSEPTDDFKQTWRQALRARLFEQRKGLSDLSGKPLALTGFHMHEGIFPRSHVSASVRWNYLIFSGVNCFLLTPEEHIPDPPDRTLCYWIACKRYGQEYVDRWIDSLPFKVRPSTPWADSTLEDLKTTLSPVVWEYLYKGKF
jgi:hypothetical protein